MIKPVPLFVGLGGLGFEVLKELAEIQEGRFLWIDQGYPIALATRMRAMGEKLPLIPTIALAGQEARRALVNLGIWNRYLKWLPERESLRILNELGPTSASGFRFLGRLSLVRAPQVLNAGLRQAVGDLLEKRTLLKDVVLIASAEGGTGSAILADVSILLRHLLPDAAIYVFLVLPPTNLNGRLRFNANAYATVKEMVAIHQRIRFDISLEGELAQERDYQQELWERVFVFSAQQHELPLYSGTVARVAGAVRVMFHENMYHHIHARSGDRAQVRWEDIGDSLFSACGGFCLILRETSAETEAVNAGMATRREEDPQHVFARSLIVLEKDGIPGRLLELRKSIRGLRGEEMRSAHREIFGIERAILGIAEAVKLPTIQSRRGGWTAFFEFFSLSVHRGSLSELLSEMRRLCMKDLHLWSEDQGQKGRTRWWYYTRVVRNFILEQRVDTAQSIFDLAKEMIGDVEQQQVAQESEALNLTIEGPNDGIEFALSQDQLSAADEVEAILRAQVFCGLYPSSADPKVFVALPRRFQGADKARLEEGFRTLAGRLRCSCEFVPSEGDELLFYYEDLFHSAFDIDRLETFKRAYETFPFRPALHTDHAFVDFVMERPVLNPGDTGTGGAAAQTVGFLTNGAGAGEDLGADSRDLSGRDN